MYQKSNKLYEKYNDGTKTIMKDLGSLKEGQNTL
jgi:hypothetical protein